MTRYWEPGYAAPNSTGVEAVSVEWEGRYVDYLLTEGLDHEKTVPAYLSKVQRVAAWAIDQGTHIDALTARQLVECAKTFKQSVSTRGHLRSALKHYYESTGRLPNPYKAIKLDKPEPAIPHPLQLEQTRVLIKASLGWFPEGLAVLSGLYLGLRRETIATMRWDGFKPDLSWYTFRTKNRRVLERPVHPILREELRGHETAYVWIFPGNRRRAHIHPATISVWVERVCQVAGIEEHVWPHRLRHTALTHMNDSTGDLRATAEFAGHADVSTTQRYTMVKGRRLERTMIEGLDYFDDKEQD